MPESWKPESEEVGSVNINRERVFMFFKYTVYVLLTIQIFVWYQVDVAASQVRFQDGVGFRTLYEAYSNTVDTAAWVVLLLLFELETYILSDDHFTRKVTWSLHGIRVFSYFFIVLAFLGFTQVLAETLATTPFEITDLCALAGSDWAYGTDLSTFILLTPENCAAFSGAEAYLKYDGINALVSAQDYSTAIGMAWADVINAGTWLLVVVVLEIDVRLQEREMLTGGFFIASTVSKCILYATLLGVAIYWTIDGGFVDSYDAWMWLIAFVFIELNIFEWRQESLEEEQA